MPLSNEELIALAMAAKPDEAVPKSKDDELLAEVEHFIFVNDIKVGTEKIKRFQILDLLERTTKTKTSPYLFMLKFTTILKRRKGEDGWHYLLDPTPFDTSREFRFKYRARMQNVTAAKKRKHDQKKAKQAEQEKQDEISRTNSQCPPKDEVGTD